MKTETMSVYDGLLLARSCFDALGETGRVLRDKFVPALHDLFSTCLYVAEVDDRIRAKYRAAGMLRKE